MDSGRNKIGMLDNKDIYEYILDNGNIKVHILNLGGTVTDIIVPDKNGVCENVVLKYKNIENYIQSSPAYFGAIIGRTAGRVPKGILKIDENEYHLDINNNGNTLHGGTNCFSTKVWDTAQFDKTYLKLIYHSSDGEQGYPGNLDVTVEYTLCKDNSLELTYNAISDKDTAVNMTNHMYFNLSGDAKEPVTNNLLYLDATDVLETDEYMIATGKVLPVKGTGYDFSKPKLVGKDFDGNYDCCFILGKNDEPKVIITHKKSGRSLTVCTDQPAIVCYSDGCNADEMLSIGRKHQKNDGICFEPQLPNIGADGKFMDLYIIKAGESYSQKTTYKFRY